MANLIPLPPEVFKKLSPKDRVTVKLILYRTDIQRSIQDTREENGMEKPVTLPRLDKTGLSNYVRKLVKEKWALPFVADARAIIGDHVGYYWIHVLCIFIKHHVLLPPPDLEEFTDEEAYISLREDQEERYYWEFRSTNNFDCIRFVGEEFTDTDLNGQVLKQQYEIAKDRFKVAQKNYREKHILADEYASPFQERIVYSSPQIEMGLRLNKVHVRLSERATKKDLLKAWKHVERCQKFIKEGKRRVTKHDEKKLDVFNEIAVWIDEYEGKLNQKNMAIKISDMLKNRSKNRSAYSIGSMRKIIQRVRELGF